MDFYFTDRNFDLLEIVSTDGNTRFSVSDETDIEEVETGSRTLSGRIYFSPDESEEIKGFCELGNYILYHDENNQDQWMTIVEMSHEPLDGVHSFVAESAGLDLLNEILGPYKASKAMSIAEYIQAFTYDSGFDLGLNEISGLRRTLHWDSEGQTALERLNSLATQFDNAEISFSFDFEGTRILKKKIDVYKQRGKEDGTTLFVNLDINQISVTGNIYDLGTAIFAMGGTPDGQKNPINLKGYKWTDPNKRFTLDSSSGYLFDHEAGPKWTRILPGQANPGGGYIMRRKSYETTDKKTLLDNALRELKKISNPAINYEVDIALLPEGINVGDTINLVDENEELYLSARILKLERSYSADTAKATLGDYLLKNSAVWQSLDNLAAQLAAQAALKQYNVTLFPTVTQFIDNAGNGKIEVKVFDGTTDVTANFNHFDWTRINSQGVQDANFHKTTTLIDIVPDAEPLWTYICTVTNTDANGDTILIGSGRVIISSIHIGASMILRQATAPLQTTNVIWIDTSNTPNITKAYDAALKQWISIHPVTAAEIGAVTEQELQGLKTGGRNLLLNSNAEPGRETREIWRAHGQAPADISKVFTTIDGRTVLKALVNNPATSYISLKNQGLTTTDFIRGNDYILTTNIFSSVASTVWDPNISLDNGAFPIVNFPRITLHKGWNRTTVRAKAAFSTTEKNLAQAAVTFPINDTKAQFYSKELIEDFEIGQQYTIFLKGTLNAGQYFVAFNTSGSADGKLGNLQLVPGFFDVYQLTFTMTKTILDAGTVSQHKLLQLYQFPQTSAGPVKIEWLKVIKGDGAEAIPEATENIADPSITFPIATSDYKIYNGHNTKPYKAGQRYTITLQGTIPASQKFGVYVNSGTYGIGNLIPIQTGSNIYKASFTLKQDVIDTRGLTNELAIYQLPNGPSVGPATIEWLKLEEGDGIVINPALNDPSKLILLMTEVSGMAAAGDFIAVDWAMLEEGTVASDWAAAPEENALIAWCDDPNTGEGFTFTEPNPNLVEAADVTGLNGSTYNDDFNAWTFADIATPGIIIDTIGWQTPTDDQGKPVDPLTVNSVNMTDTFYYQFRIQVTKNANKVTHIGGNMLPLLTTSVVAYIDGVQIAAGASFATGVPTTVFQDGGAHTLVIKGKYKSIADIANLADKRINIQLNKGHGNTNDTISGLISRIKGETGELTDYTPAVADDPEKAGKQYVGYSTKQPGPYLYTDFKWTLNGNYTMTSLTADVASKVDKQYFEEAKADLSSQIADRATEAEFALLQQTAQTLQNSLQAFISDGGTFQTELAAAEARTAAQVAELGDETAKFNFLSSWIELTPEGLVIGSNTSEMKMLLTNDTLAFMQNGETIAYFSGANFYINSGAVLSDLQIGRHKTTKLSDDTTVIQFVG